MAFLAVACLSVSGCWNGGNTQLAGGTVSVDGTPVTMGKVTFYPLGGGRTGTGRIQPDGSFVLSYRKPGDGVPLGEYKVSIIADLWEERKPKGGKRDTIEEAEIEDAEFRVGEGRLIHVVPTKYNSIETTPLKVVVNESGQSQQFNFDITTEE
ncbi:MAG: hypothetical protein RH917_05960 [Lacipirellulaceae bacterium]